MVEQVANPGAPVIGRLREAAAAERAAQAAQAAAILDLAREAEWDENAEFDMVGTRPIRIGADGTRLVDEHLPLEVAAALGISVDAAIWLIRDVVNLAARLPRAWHAVQTGKVSLWRARDLTQRTEAAGLERAECLQVDRAIAPALGVVGWRRLGYLTRAAMMTAAPEKLRAQAERARANRYVRTAPLPDDPASSYLAGRVDTADARGFDDLLDRVADALAGRGEPGDHDQLRARAVGVLSGDLTEALALLEAFDGDAATNLPRRPTRRPHRVYVHLNGAALGGNAVADVEGLGPVLADQLTAILGDRPITLTSVVHAGPSPRGVDSYAIPERIREDVVVRDRFEVFPFSSRNARSCDLDHTVAFAEGGPRQTRPGNLGPLSRRAHRGKTHGGWKLDQPHPGVFWWRSPRGQVFRISNKGTWDLTPDPDPDGCNITLTIWRYLDKHTDQDGTWRGPP